MILTSPSRRPSAVDSGWGLDSFVSTIHLQVSQVLHTMQTDLLPPAGDQGNYRGIRFPSMLILTAPCGRVSFLCSAKRRLCFSSMLMAFLQPLYRGPITAQLLSSLTTGDSCSGGCSSIKRFQLRVLLSPLKSQLNVI